MTASRSWKKYIGLAGILFLFPLTWWLVFARGSVHHFTTTKYFSPDAPQGNDTPTYVIPPFAFEDHTGQVFTSDSLTGKTWMAVFMNTGEEMLPRITQRLLLANFPLRNELDVHLVLFSTNCEIDQPERIKSYVEQVTKGLYPQEIAKWHYLRAKDDSTMKKFFAEAFFVKNLKEEARFRLVDQLGYVRGLYGNTEYHVQSMVEDVRIVKKQYDIANYTGKNKIEKVGN
jgi:cytochrome oxidase Cu insertion factor (SCO1/SenC/PrrC family)